MLGIYVQPVAQQNEFEALAAAVRDGSPKEKDRALDELDRIARKVGSPEGWNRLALALKDRGRFSESAAILRKLSKSEAADHYKLNLAVIYSQARHIDLARYYLGVVAATGKSPESRQHASEQLASYNEFLGFTKEAEELARLQLQVLRQQVQSAKPAAAAIAKLAQMLLGQAFLISDEQLSLEARGVLTKGSTLYPDDEEILELLVRCYIGADETSVLGPVLNRLRALTQRSSLLALLDQAFENAQSGAEIVAARADVLLPEVFQAEDEAVRRAASGDLGRLVAENPENSWLRVQYAWSLALTRQPEGALDQAERVANLENRSHEFHFNLGQILWMCGDSSKGRRHLELAIARARTKAEANDARERIAELSATADTARATR